MHKDWLGKTKDKEEPRKGEHMQLGLNYRGGPLSVDQRQGLPDHVTRAGDRAPDAPLFDSAGKPCRLFDLYRGPHFTLLAIGDAQMPPLNERFARGVRSHRIMRSGRESDRATLIDMGGHVHRHYSEGFILVRPDGYLGYAGPSGSAAALSQYLERFFI
jgi:hypothetical protein